MVQPTLTEDKVRNMINDALRTWEKEYGDVRHRENIKKFDQVFALINGLRGGMYAVGGIITLLGLVLTVLKLYEVAHH